MYGCVFDVMELSCDVGEMIFVTEALYGAYDATCEDECCVPDRGVDCLESISSEDLDTWNLIRVDCNYKESCLFQYQGHELLPCSVALADYMIITYTCASGKNSTCMPWQCKSVFRGTM